MRPHDRPSTAVCARLAAMAFLLALGSLFPIMNPVAALPVFADLTEGRDARSRARTARTTGIAVLVILAVSAVVGRYLLEALGISVAALQVAGGLIVGGTGLAMVRGSSSRISPAEHSETTASSGAVGVVPMAIPMIAGPGAISAVIAITGREQGLLALLQILAAAVVMAALVFVVLRLGEPLLDRLGTTGIGVLTRIFGLIILAIAVELAATGLGQLFPGLAAR